MAVPEWKKFEDAVQKLFETRAETERLIYHRFYDTHSAQGFLPAQPGDHLVIWHGVPVLIETKYSSRLSSLYSCFSEMVKSHQIGSHRLWLRAGAQTMIAFKGTDGYELWDGAHCVECRSEGKRLNKDTRLKVGGSLPDLFRNVEIPCPNRYRKIYLFD